MRGPVLKKSSSKASDDYRRLIFRNLTFLSPAKITEIYVVTTRKRIIALWQKLEGIAYLDVKKVNQN